MTKCFHAVFALSLLAATSGHADGGAILARRAINGLEVTIFASPVPPRAGPVDVSVLVQRDESAILDAEVKVAWQTLSSSPPDWLPPCCTMNRNAEWMPALRAHSNNKLLYSAVIPLKSSGPSELMISVTDGAREALLSCQIEVRPPLAPALAFWPWLLFPPTAVACFALHQRLARSGPTSDQTPLREKS